MTLKSCLGDSSTHVVSKTMCAVSKTLQIAIHAPTEREPIPAPMGHTPPELLAPTLLVNANRSTRTTTVI